MNPQTQWHRSLLKQYAEKVYRHACIYAKRVIFFLRGPADRTKLVFVLGYGRSGTSILLKSLDRDLRIEVLGENDPKVACDYVLNPHQVPAVLARSSAQAMVLKPILNSFEAPYLLDEFPSSRIIWMVRHYKDVVASASKRFGDTVATYMKDLVRTGTGENWLARGAPHEILAEVRKMDTTAFSPHDWLGLVWLVVNRTVVDHNLLNDPRVMIVRYEDLTSQPDQVMRSIYDLLGLSRPRFADLFFDTRSVGKGAHITLHQQVERACSALQSRLNEATCSI